MIESVEIQQTLGLEDYAADLKLAEAVRSLRAAAELCVPRLAGRKIWMVNSTAQGGGVAEMLPQLVAVMRELGVDVEWVVMSAHQPKFFVLTKRLHNLIHGHGEPRISAEDCALYEAVSRENAEILENRMRSNDVLVIHDPQPLGMGALLKRELGIPAIFRCHIGLEQELPQTRAAWDFLRPFAEAYDYSVFSAPAYVPDFLSASAGIIRPAIDPLSWKNRELTPQKLVGILCNARLAVEQHPVVPLPYPETAKRLCPDGSFAPADHSGGIGILYRPIVLQVSRWDRLKGFKPLLDGFVRLKEQLASRPDGRSERHRRRLELARLVLAGPDPDAVADDPEGCEVLGELIETYRGLPPALQQDVALISLPMNSQKHNALMVNALQRCASIVVQNSIREGFGLTVTEAMWKRAAVLGSRAYGIGQQIRDGVDGRLVADAEDSDALASCLDQMLEDLPERVRLGQSAQRRAHAEFLIFHQVRRWLELLSERLDP